EDAIREYESSIALKPSVAACAMHGLALFDASLLSGNGPDRYFRGVKRDLLNSLKPETAEDYLFRGLSMQRFMETGVYKEGHFKSDQALEDINRAIEMRDTAVARAFRPAVAWEIAARAGERKMGLDDRPLAGLREAKRLLPDNKFLRFKGVYGGIGTADLYHDAKQPEKEEAALVEAGQDAKELKGIPNHAYVMARVHYFERRGNTEAALQELEAASRLPETSDLVARYALVLYEHGRDTEALRVLNDGLRLKPDNAAGQMLRIILEAEDPDVGHKEAYRRYLALIEERKREGKWCPYDSIPGLLFGKKKEAADRAKDFVPGIRWEKYLAGGLS